MITIKSNHLQVNIAQPGETPNDTSRFDRAGFITDITLDKKYQFCTSEPTNLAHPTSGGRGLCNEFCYDNACAEAKVGDKFPKFGIGLFDKIDMSPFCFYRKYNIEPYPVRWVQTKNSIVFETEAVPCLGYALRHEKTLEVKGNTLAITVKIENVGEKEVNMKEYCHNFLTIDGLPLGINYFIDLPGIVDKGNNEINGTIKGNGKGLTFSGYTAKSAFVNIGEEDIVGNPFTWKISNTMSDVYIEAIEHFKPCELIIWAIDNIISVEAFRRIVIKPSENDIWKRSWLFGEV